MPGIDYNLAVPPAVSENTLLYGIYKAVQSGGGGGSGTVTSVAASFTGGIVSVAGSPITASGSLDFTVAGTSGGIPYFSSATGWASSAALAANALVVGGGAGVAPSTVTTGTGVLTALGVNTGSAGAFVVNGGALGTPSGGTLTNCTGLPAGGVTGLGTMATQNDSAVAITGGTIAALTGFSLRDTSAAFNVTLAATSTTALTAARSITLDCNNTSQTLKFTAASTVTFPAGTNTLLGSAVANTITTNGAASTPSFNLTGTPFTGGSSTTTKPLHLIEPTGTMSNAWNTNGTMLGINAPSGFAGNLLDIKANSSASARFAIDSNGNGTFGASVSVGSYIQALNHIYLETNGGRLYFGAADDIVLSRTGAASLKMGLDHATSPTAQTIASHNVTTGTGANMIIGAGSGSVAGGQVQLATRATTGSLVAALIVKASGVLNSPTMPTSLAGLSSGDIYSNAGILTIV